MRILIVESDKIIGDGLVAALSAEGYAVDWIEDSTSATLALDSHTYDIILIDMDLPNGCALELLTQIRLRDNHSPILLLSSYEKESYKVEGLDAGADDYLIKPFKLDELHARIRALHRRRHGLSTSVLKVSDIELNPATRRVMKSGIEVLLGSKEFSILQLLMEKKDEVVSKQAIEDNIYGWNTEVNSNTLEVHIYKLRKKLGKDLIETIKYVGYRLKVNDITK